jgi:hypothetical protein
MVTITKTNGEGIQNCVEEKVYLDGCLLQVLDLC